MKVKQMIDHLKEYPADMELRIEYEGFYEADPEVVVPYIETEGARFGNRLVMNSFLVIGKVNANP